MKLTLNDKRNVIISHYDELVKQITLYSEEILKKINASTLITELPRYPSYLGKISTFNDTNEYGIEGLIDRYPKEFDLSGGNDENDSLDVSVHLGETKVTEYVRMIAERAIEEIRKAQHENLVRLDESSKQTDPEMDVDDEDEPDQNQNYIRDEMEELRETLFADKFAFFVMIEDAPNDLKVLTEGKENKFIFKMYVIVVDFYMSVGDIELLEFFLNETLMPSNNSLESTFNQKSLLVELLWKYICARVADYPKFGNEVIRVSKNRLLSMQRISFYHSELDLDKAIIKATEGLDFSNLRSLQLIICDEKEAIHIRTLKGLFNLEYLHLRNAVFNPSILKDLTKLRSLALARYDCQDMNELFGNAPNLVSLYLCQSKNEPNFDFKSLPKLRYLNLTDRFISQKSLQKQLMTLNDEMKIIQLAQCGITHKGGEAFFKEIMTKFRDLAKLEIEECNIQALCKEWFDGMSQLRELNLSGDKLTVIGSDDFENLKNLEVLNLECNKFKSLEANTFSSLKNLKSLWLAGNTNVQEVHSDAFNGLDNLEELDLEELGLFKRNDKALKGDWLRFANLKKLSLNCCSLKSIDSAVFINMPKLEELDLSSNKLEINANSFQNLTNLKRLDLAYNNLKKIPPLVFSSLSSLEQLDLSENCLTELKPEMFTGLENLKKLELKSNAFKNFSNDVLENLKKLEEVLLD